LSDNYLNEMLEEKKMEIRAPKFFEHMGEDMIK
jgi:hypothetical protein